MESTIAEVELRQYAPHILAEVTVDGDRRSALNTGFRVLAGYIFGGNSVQASVAMTVPVAQRQPIDMTAPVAQAGQDGLWTVSFMMPRDWTLDTRPCVRQRRNCATRWHRMASPRSDRPRAITMTIR